MKTNGSNIVPYDRIELDVQSGENEDIKKSNFRIPYTWRVMIGPRGRSRNSSAAIKERKTSKPANSKDPGNHGPTINEKHWISEGLSSMLQVQAETE
ncbi:hypothetical protein V6N12_041348 [Hibiscus sabdariffa]|uniref:Uncharacterized protein n=1 Tax=Hibiscus sabdariffa TaxID=183260 RepID=A0ABR2E7X7_9ROSI